MPIKKIQIVTFSVAAFMLTTNLFVVQPAWAQECQEDPNSQSPACLFEKEGTAFGIFCKDTWDPACIVNSFLTLALSIVGGLAFLLLIFGSFRVLTSTGNPEVLNEGRDIIVSAIAGLIFTVFSVVLLKIIGLDIFPIF